MRTLQANDFEVGFLEGWSDSSQIVLIGVERPFFTPNLQVHRETLPDVPLDEFFRGQRSELSELDGFRLIEHGDRLLGGTPALHHAYSWALPNANDLRVRQLQIVTSQKGALFTVTCSALEQDWDVVESGFELALAHFAWR
ncbi:MAG: DcrB [Thermoleophilia bacterium]|nr:DcrB [Thermoleophilia bacterium]